MWALVPLKLLANAKARLASELTSTQRQQLVLAMASDVLSVLQASHQVSHTLLISRNVEAEALAQEFDAECFAEADGSDLPEALIQGVAYAKRAGASGVCILPADAPLLTVADIDLLLQQHQTCTVVPDAQCIGTNALVLSPPDIMAPIFDGSSFKPHLRAAVSARLAVRVFATNRLGLDIDTPEDLETLRASTATSRTKQCLKTLTDQ